MANGQLELFLFADEAADTRVVESFSIENDEISGSFLLDLSTEDPSMLVDSKDYLIFNL